MTFLDRLYDRKFSGLSLLATGAIGIGLGWAVTAFLATYHVPVVPAHDDCTSEQQNESEMDLVSEPETPRDFGDGPRHQPPRRTVTPLSFNNAHAQADYKQVIIIRTDLDMPTGKIAAQACHASVTAVKKAWKMKDPAYKPWESSNATKVCLAADSEQELLAVRDQARKAGLQTAVVVDASSGSTNRSVLAVGPGASSVINSFTHQLKIYDD